jgi:hypothetical protein
MGRPIDDVVIPSAPPPEWYARWHKRLAACGVPKRRAKQIIRSLERRRKEWGI